MRVFLDANVIISVLNKEYPIFTYSSRILSQAHHARFQLFTTPLSLAITFYFASKKSGSKLAKRKMKMLKEHVQLALVDEDVVYKALNEKAVHDFEDGMQYYAALNAGCHCIITENNEDFYFGDLEIISCEGFFKKYLANSSTPE